MKRHWFVAVLLFGFILYGWNLWVEPAYLNQDEIMFALNAKSISESGRDFYGNFLPTYFWHLDSFWATPVIVYWSSLFMKSLPFNEFVVRLPTVILMILSTGLLMYLSKIVFKNKPLSIISGILFLLTPALFINSRLLLDNIYPVFFVIAALIFLVNENLFLNGLVLGIGLHSYHAAKIYMPIYLFASIIHTKKWFKQVLGFVLPLILVVTNPQTLVNQINYAKSIDSGFSFSKVGDILIRYFSYFDPKILFISGDRSLIHSTTTVGIFTFPMVFLLLFGIIEIIKNKDRFGKLLLFGLLTYPVAPSLLNDPERISRSLIIVPFVVLISTYGARFLMNCKEIYLKKFLYINIFLIVINFVIFLNNYFGIYLSKKVRVFNYNIGGAIESVIKSKSIRKVNNIYFDKNIFFINYYVSFYEIKHGIKLDVKYVDTSKIDYLTSGDIIVLNKKVNINKFEIIETIYEPDGVESYFVYFRDSSI